MLKNNPFKVYFLIIVSNKISPIAFHTICFVYIVQIIIELQYIA
jgi:hypothetical protein